MNNNEPALRETRMVCITVATVAFFICAAFAICSVWGGHQ